MTVAEIKKLYQQAPTTKKHWAVCGPEFLSEILGRNLSFSRHSMVTIAWFVISGNTSKNVWGDWNIGLVWPCLHIGWACGINSTHGRCYSWEKLQGIQYTIRNDLIHFSCLVSQSSPDIRECLSHLYSLGELNHEVLKVVNSQWWGWWFCTE